MKVRWWVCLLLFLTWLMSYIDRSLMPMALPFIGQEFHLNPTVMGAVVGAFFIGYAAMQIPGGLIADRFGARNSITLGVAAWSVFSLLTGVARSLTTLMWVRILFGLGEGLHPPAAFKVLSVWFKSAERARANGLVMSSNALGPVVAPVVFAALMQAFGWRRAFYFISIPGFLIALSAYWYLRDKPEEHPTITPSELAEITGEGGKTERITLSELLRYRALWRLFFVYMAWDVTWWGFSAWLPTYLLKGRGFTLLHTGALTALPYAAGFVGLMVAAHISDRSRKHRWVFVAIMLGDATFMLLTATAGSAATAVVFLTAAGFFLPAIHAPFWSLVMDLLPSRVMGYSTGFINTGGQIAGICSPIILGALIQLTRHYNTGFVFMAVSAGVSAVLAATLGEASAEASARPIPIATPVKGQRA